MPRAEAVTRTRTRRAGVAQLVEQSPRKRQVDGSSPSAGTIHFTFKPGLLAAALKRINAEAIIRRAIRKAMRNVPA